MTSPDVEVYGAAPTDMTTEAAAPHEEHHDGSFYAILFLFVSLVVGAVSRHMLARIPVPYTCLLLVWGIVFGLLESFEGSFGDPFHQAVTIWLAMTPHLLLYTFLPILLFASAFSMDWHIFKVCIGQCLTLAGPGVVISTALTAIFGKFVLPYGWSWPKSLLFGCILSATDPVAVVALLKEVGASKKLGIVIEGESLLNDGTAFVLFLVFKEMVDGIQLGPAEIVLKFVRLALGGPAVGILFGMVATAWLSRIFNDACLEISITLTLAYLCFFTAEGILGVSSVLAIVSCGVFMSAVGKTRITPSVEHPMEIFWEMLEYLGNTVIFVYSGLKVGVILADDSAGNILGADWGWCILLFVVLQIIRGLTVAILYPLLRRMGYGITWKTAVVMVWGGLRGAMGLALALIVLLDDQISDLRFRSLIAFLTSMIAVLTIAVNGTTMPYLLSSLGILSVSKAKREFLQHSLTEMNEGTESQCSHLKFDDLMGNPDWELVKSLTFIETKQIDKSHVKRDSPAQRSSHISAGIRVEPQEPSFTTLEVYESDRVMDARVRFLSIVKTSYGEGFEKGYISSWLLNTLKESADKCLDDSSVPLKDWSYLEGVLVLPRWVTVMNNYFHINTDKTTDKRTAIWERAVNRLAHLPQDLLYNKLRDCAVIAMSFVFAHSQARHSLNELLAAETRNHGNPRLVEVAKRSYETIIGESVSVCKAAEKFITGLKLAYPEVMRMIKTQLTAHTLLMHKQRFVKSVIASGLVDEKEGSQMSDLVNLQVKKLHFQQLRPAVREPMDILYTQSIFTTLSEDNFKARVLPCAKHHVFQVQEAINLMGSSGGLTDKSRRPSMVAISETLMKSLSKMNFLEMDDDGNIAEDAPSLAPREEIQQVFCVTHGFTFKVHSGTEDIYQQGPGSVLGITTLLSGLECCKMVAETTVEGFFISTKSLKAIMDEFPEVEEDSCRRIAKSLLDQAEGDKSAFAIIKPEGMQAGFQAAKLVKMQSGEDICVMPRQLGLLVSGQVEVEEGRSLGILRAPYAIDPTKVGNTLRAITASRLLMLNNATMQWAIRTLASSSSTAKLSAVGSFKPIAEEKLKSTVSKIIQDIRQGSFDETGEVTVRKTKAAWAEHSGPASGAGAPIGPRGPLFSAEAIDDLSVERVTAGPASDVHQLGVPEDPNDETEMDRLLPPESRKRDLYRCCGPPSRHQGVLNYLSFLLVIVTTKVLL